MNYFVNHMAHGLLFLEELEVPTIIFHIRYSHY